MRLSNTYVRRSRAGRAAIAAAVLMAGATLTAAPAQAAPGGDTTVVSSTFTLAAGATGGRAAMCPAGRRVTGGGVGTTAANVGSVVQVSGPLDNTGMTQNTIDGDSAHYWYAHIRNGSDVARTYKVFALCSATSDATIEETTFWVAGSGYPSNGTAGARAVRCPTGRYAVGGGIGTTATYVDSWTQVSGPLDETGSTYNTATGDRASYWYSSIFNRGATGRYYKAFALCSANTDARIVASSFVVGRGWGDVPTGAPGAAAAQCPAGRRASGGGLGTTAATVSSSVQVSGPLDQTGATVNTSTGDAARYWYANVYNGGDVVRTYKTFALCVAEA